MTTTATNSNFRVKNSIEILGTSVIFINSATISNTATNFMELGADELTLIAGGQSVPGLRITPGNSSLNTDQFIISDQGANTEQLNLTNSAATFTPPIVANAGLTIGNGSPGLTFGDATVQTTAYTGLGGNGVLKESRAQISTATTSTIVLVTDSGSDSAAGIADNMPAYYDSSSTQWLYVYNNAPVSSPSGFNGVINYLLVAGGGGGGSGNTGGSGGGGGGAGGLIADNVTGQILGTVNWTVTVGAGGGGSTGLGIAGGQGSDSTIAEISVTALGGGGGGSTNNSPGQDATSGGSGGGAANWGGVGNYGSGTAGQGHDGGSNGSSSAPAYGTGGGGGAGTAGNNGSDTAGGAGGDGVQSSITGTATYYAGGGGGSAYIGTRGAGGLGGGGAGNNGNDSATAGTNGLGGGGGGATPQNGHHDGGDGGSGIAIISYQYPTQAGTGGTVTSYTDTGNTYWVHTFATSGTFTL